MPRANQVTWFGAAYQLEYKRDASTGLSTSSYSGGGGDSGGSGGTAGGAGGGGNCGGNGGDAGGRPGGGLGSATPLNMSSLVKTPHP
eukprot:7386596-Prymnesium_polylepis.1